MNASSCPRETPESQTKSYRTVQTDQAIIIPSSATLVMFGGISYFAQHGSGTATDLQRLLTVVPSDDLLLSQLLLQRQREQEARQRIEDELVLQQWLRNAAVPTVATSFETNDRRELEQQIVGIAYQFLQEQIQRQGGRTAPTPLEVAQLAQELLHELLRQEAVGEPSSTTAIAAVSPPTLRTSLVAHQLTVDPALLAALLETQKQTLNKAGQSESGTLTSMATTLATGETIASSTHGSSNVAAARERSLDSLQSLEAQSHTKKTSKEVAARGKETHKTTKKTDETILHGASTGRLSDNTLSTDAIAQRAPPQITNIAFFKKKRGKGKSIMDIVLGKLPGRTPREQAVVDDVDGGDDDEVDAVAAANENEASICKAAHLKPTPKKVSMTTTEEKKTSRKQPPANAPRRSKRYRE